MRIAVTGGTGFVGRHLADTLLEDGHEVVLISRGRDRHGDEIRQRVGVRCVSSSVDDEAALEGAFAGCDAVAHCAGINREIGRQTYRNVHVRGTQVVVNAAKRAGVGKVVLLSFLRARPDCGSGYHESKWRAEEIVRASGLDYTVVKSGVIYGRGDHMLDHLSRAFLSFPVFGLVGFQDRMIAPMAVQDMARLLKAALVDGALSRRTVAVTGPEVMTLRTAVQRVAGVVGRNPVYVRLPIWIHHLLGRLLELVMKVPLISTAQVRILSEGVVEPLPPCDPLPPALAPLRAFTEAQIRCGLPDAAPFGFSDLRCCCRT